MPGEGRRDWTKSTANYSAATTLTHHASSRAPSRYSAYPVLINLLRFIDPRRQARQFTSTRPTQFQACAATPSSRWPPRRPPPRWKTGSASDLGAAARAAASRTTLTAPRSKPRTSWRGLGENAPTARFMSSRTRPTTASSASATASSSTARSATARSPTRRAPGTWPPRRASTWAWAAASARTRPPSDYHPTNGY